MSLSVLKALIEQHHMPVIDQANGDQFLTGSLPILLLYPSGSAAKMWPEIAASSELKSENQIGQVFDLNEFESGNKKLVKRVSIKTASRLTNHKLGHENHTLSFPQLPRTELDIKSPHDVLKDGPIHLQDICPVQPDTSFAELPLEWRCPVCDAPHERFMENSGE